MINVLELFGGISAYRKALINLNISFKVIDYVEIDHNAVKIYNSIYNTNYESKSIINYSYKGNKKIDLLVGSPPCQDISLIDKNNQNNNYCTFHQEFVDEINKKRINEANQKLIENINNYCKQESETIYIHNSDDILGEAIYIDKFLDKLNNGDFNE